MTYGVGDFIVLTCKRTGDTFRGVVNRVHPQYVVINGYGFPLEDYDAA